MIKPNLPKPPQIPSLIQSKIYKSGQTRGADDDVIYQNRVSRNSTVLIPYSMWEQASNPPGSDAEFEKNFIALLRPEDYFTNPNITAELFTRGLVLGKNALVFYQTRSSWIENNPAALGWTAAQKRIHPLDGKYVARIAATTSLEDGGKIIRGFDTTSCKGAGIRLYEYANMRTIKACRLQLETLFWLCNDSQEVSQQNGMSEADAKTRRLYIEQQCNLNNLFDIPRLREARIINSNGHTICPLCLKELSAQGFFNKVAQAVGREVHDLTVTQLNLFHVSELRYGVYNHRPYNLGWGHHHCNVVVKDSGIMETLEWMHNVVQKNKDDGHFNP